MADEAPTCANCKKTASAANLASLKACAKCKKIQYCGRDCQKADWKTHKKVCAKNAAENFVEANAEHSSTYSAARLKDLETHVPNPFTRLDQGKYLHDRPEKDVFKLLIDSFRMRQADDFNLQHKTTPRSVYTGAGSSIEPFRRYLAKAATRSSLLPSWWTADKQKECEAFGESGAWSDLRKKVTKQEMIQHYGDEKMPMQVRMLAEAVYGVGTMGQDGSGMRKVMMQMEKGGPGNGQHMSMMNLAQYG
ncbi:Nn.00g070650.m01.CDS01 [Neocucurbitaria sp. VM-36]